MVEAAPALLTWAGLPNRTRELLTGRLAGLWEAPTDAAAFDSWADDKKRALLLVLMRMEAKGLWHLVKRITNVYGEGGVGIQFLAWPMIESTLSRRRDFTRLFANHKDTTGGFYEKRRGDAVRSLQSRSLAGECVEASAARVHRESKARLAHDRQVLKLLKILSAFSAYLCDSAFNRRFNAENAENAEQKEDQCLINLRWV
jgi:hypothetical protein